MTDRNDIYTAAEVEDLLQRLGAALRVVATMREIVASPAGEFDMNAARRALERFDRGYPGERRPPPQRAISFGDYVKTLGELPELRRIRNETPFEATDPDSAKEDER